MASEKRAQCSEEEEENGTPSAEPKFKIPRKSPNKAPEEDNSRDIRQEDNSRDIRRKILEAQTRVKEKEDTLRKLRLVKLYRTKWETQGLDSITGQWLRACQEALVELREKARDMRETGEEALTLKILIDNLGLDSKLLKLDEEYDCFVT